MKDKKSIADNFGACPIPLDNYPHIVMAHGGGGQMTNQLIKEMFNPVFNNQFLAAEHDGAVFDSAGKKAAFTTDSYVIQPLFFPGGDIGSLAVYGTVNDLCMCGAVPAYISLSLIIEEGLPMQNLWRIINSIQKAAERTGVQIVTGDTKVIDKTGGGGLYINTSGIGFIEHDLNINPAAIRNGDLILLSGDIGRHGIAVMATREGLEFETELTSDCAPLNDIVQKILTAGIPVHCMRDLTRGGLASALIEIAHSAGNTLEINEETVPVTDAVGGACELLGFDPVYVANEGRFVMFVPQEHARQCLKICRNHAAGESAAVIGRVTEKKQGTVVMKNRIGGQRILHMFSGEQLPRIC
ncbi:hydrogenase expression/formation protein HypE [candidate division KSB1 bacterium]|nr:hydrogenase expression/formation protein HypE [candidate division KSB1 bacterium]